MNDSERTEFADLIAARIANAMEDKGRVAVLESRMDRMQRDIDAAHELSRQHSHQMGVTIQQLQRVEMGLAPLARIEALLSDSEEGIVVRLTKAEGKVVNHDESIAGASKTAKASVVGVIAFVAVWLWNKVVNS